MKPSAKKKRLLIYDKYNGRCAYCGEKIEYSNMHVDHINPLFRKSSNKYLFDNGIIKGSSSIDNLNPSCPTCNISKSTFTLEVWRNELKLKADRLIKRNVNFRILLKYKLITLHKNKDVIFYFEKH